MHTLSLILADGVTIQLGGNVWNFGINFIIYLIVAAVIGLVAEVLRGRRLPSALLGLSSRRWLVPGYSQKSSSLMGLVISTSMEFPLCRSADWRDYPGGHSCNS